jgi:hypothetical protein
MLTGFGRAGPSPLGGGGWDRGEVRRGAAQPPRKSLPRLERQSRSVHHLPSTIKVGSSTASIAVSASGV